MRETSDPIESAGIARTREASTDADLVVLLRDEAGTPVTRRAQVRPGQTLAAEGESELRVANGE